MHSFFSTNLILLLLSSSFFARRQFRPSFLPFSDTFQSLSLFRRFPFFFILMIIFGNKDRNPKGAPLFSFVRLIAVSPSFHWTSLFFLSFWLFLLLRLRFVPHLPNGHTWNKGQEHLSSCIDPFSSPLLHSIVLALASTMLLSFPTVSIPLHDDSSTLLIVEGLDRRFSSRRISSRVLNSWMNAAIV